MNFVVVEVEAIEAATNEARATLPSKLAFMTYKESKVCNQSTIKATRKKSK